MKHIGKCILIIVAALAFSCSDDSANAINDDKFFVENVLSGFTRALNKKDTTDLSSLVADSVRLMHPTKRSQLGTSPFKQFVLKSRWEQFQLLDPHIEISENKSIVSSQVSFRIDQKKPKNPVLYRGEVLLVISKTDEGLWKIDELAYASWKRKNQKAQKATK